MLFFGLVVGCTPVPSSVPAATAPAVQQPANPTPSATARLAVANGTLTVELFEWSVSTDPIDVPPGTYKVNVINQGRRVHSVTISGPGGEAESRRLNPGASQILTAIFKQGETTLWCAIGDHRDMGMETYLKVS